MLEAKDPVIKLFGKTISLPSNKAPLAHHDHDHEQSSCSTSEDNKSTSGVLTRSRLEDDSIDPTKAEPIEPATPSGDTETLKTRGTDTETLSPKVPKTEEQSETSASQEKTLKKPDKILPCPRCNSMDTKFCYYNNYNVNQPRHFCKNCQRYWTAGGTMRNVPVGSGRRKIKNSFAFNYRHIMFSEALQAAQADTPNGIHLSPLKADGTFLAFSSERPLCDSKASAINLAERAPNCVPNGFHGAEQRIPVSCDGRDHLNGSSSMSLNLIETGGNAGLQESILKNYQCFTPQVPYYSGTPWPSQLNSAHWTSPAPPHSSNPSGFPVTSYPATPYWCGTVASPRNVPWLSSSPTPPKHSPLSTSPTSPTLGKHSRDGSMIKSANLGEEEPVEEDLKKSLLLPKTLRISNSISAASLFKAFRPKVDEKNHVADTFLILQANPAAFSRSINFREST